MYKNKHRVTCNKEMMTNNRDRVEYGCTGVTVKTSNAHIRKTHALIYVPRFSHPTYPPFFLNGAYLNPVDLKLDRIPPRQIVELRKMAPKKHASKIERVGRGRDNETAKTQQAQKKQ